MTDTVSYAHIACDKRLLLHAKEWLNNIDAAKPSLDRLSHAESESFNYITNIFNNPAPDFDRLRTCRELLHSTAMEMHDKFGAALRCVSAKVVLITRDFEGFRNALAASALSEPVHTVIVEEKKNDIAADITLRLIQRIEYDNGCWYEGYLDSDGKWNGEGKYYDSYRCGILYGTFVHGEFPDVGKFVDSYGGTYEGEIRKVQKGTAFALFGKGKYTTYDNEVFESDKILIINGGNKYDRLEFRFDHNATVSITFADGNKFHGKAYQLDSAAGEYIHNDGTVENCDILFNYYVNDKALYKIKTIDPGRQSTRNTVSWIIGIAAVLSSCIFTPGMSHGWLFFIAMFLIAISTMKIYSDIGKSAIISAPFLSMALMLVSCIYLSVSVSWWYLLGIPPAALFGFGALMTNYKFHNLSGDDFYFGD